MKRLFLVTLIFLLSFSANAQQQDPCYSINNFITQQNIINPPISYQLSGGWNMVGYTGTAENSGIANQINSALSNDSSIESTFQIIKNVSGQFWSSNFAQLLSFTQGEGYMMYVISETATSLSFNNPINIPEIIGCTDCEAINFNQWANLDDGSCNYDSDGDGVLDFDEVVGCQEANACNFDALATDTGECITVEAYFNCDGTPHIGASFEGGILFYLDETGQRGLVVANEYIGEFEWGCSEVLVQGSNLSIIGSGLQNTLDIVSHCPENPIAASEALEFEVEGYADWFLPSKDELHEIYNAFGCYDSINIGSLDGFTWSSTEVNTIAATVFNCSNGLNIGFGKNAPFKTRPIRAFGAWTMGCMDTTACNYNNEANMADGSCTYPEQGYDCDGNITAEIGDIIEGGYLFYLDESGARGLVAAMEDLSGVYQWGCYQESVDGGDGIAIGTGFQNTLDVSAQNCQPQNEGITAAQATINFESQGYSDWYLPSFGELNKMAESIIAFDLSVFNISENQWYWSSSEFDNDNANGVILTNGTNTNFAKYNSNLVRAIRSFGNWIEGCSDESACNYNLEANMGDGTCTYREQGYDCNGNLLPEIGSLMNGGIVFYIDESGEHGLVAAIEDLEGTYEWGCHGTSLSGADGQAIGTGYQNTLDIVAGCSDVNIAAFNALNSTTEGYTDWYLPSKDELEEMYFTIGNVSPEGNIGGFQDKWYWSSSEYDYQNNYAWIVFFSSYYTIYNPKNLTYRVRVIRAF